MFFAFFRLIMIAVSVVLVFAIIVGALRFVGKTQTYTSAPHPLLDNPHLVIAWGGDSRSDSPFSAAAYKSAAQSHCVLGVDLRLSRDGVWYIYPDKYLPTGKNEFLTHKTSAELDALSLPAYGGHGGGHILRFDQLFAQSPKSLYYLVINNPASPYLENLFKMIEAAHSEDQFILSSPFADTTKFLRDRSAHWLTDSTTSEIAKAKLLTSLFLESLITNTGEVMTLDKVNEPLMRELRKRRMAVLLKTDEASVVTSSLFDNNLITGVVTSRPSQFIAQ